MARSAFRAIGVTIGVWLLSTAGCGGGNETKKALSEGCVANSDCADGLICSFGHCHQQCSATRDCPAGARCVKAADNTNTCQLPEEEKCRYNSDCPAPLVCATDGECRNQCQENRDCITGQICTTSKVCAEPTEVDSQNNLVGAGGTSGGGGAGGAADTGGSAQGGVGGGAGSQATGGAAGVTGQAGTSGGGETAQGGAPSGGAALGGTTAGGGADTGGSTTAEGGSTTAEGGSPAGGVPGSGGTIGGGGVAGETQSIGGAGPVGGTAGLGGTAGAAGEVLTGGVPGSGGAVVAGGASTGGTDGAATGGSPGSGGVVLTGGTSAGGSAGTAGADSGGSPGSGGAGVTGGTSIGGAMTGGTASGGLPGSGGVILTGGTSTGGTVATGGMITGGWPGAAGVPCGTAGTAGAGGGLDSGYLTSGPWTGHVGNWASGTGSTVTPADHSAHVAGAAFCASGTVGAMPDSSGTAGIALNLNQALCSADLGTWTPAELQTSGISVNVTNTGNSPLRVQVTSATQAWCVQLAQFGQLVQIPWSWFNTTCWTTGGTQYAGEPLMAASVYVPGATSATNFNFCINSIAPGSSPGASAVPTGCSVPATTTRYFCDDFESGMSKWTLTGQDWGSISWNGRSGSTSLTDSPGGSYVNDADASAIMLTAVDLTSASAPVLVYWQKLALNNLYASGTDSANVEASADGGVTWSQLTAFGSGSNTTTWSQQELNLASYAGKRVKIRFRLWDNAGGAQSVGDGWYVDDVEIRELDLTSTPPADAGGCNAPTTTRYFCDGFEAGLGNWIASSEDWNTTSANTPLSGTHLLTDSPFGSYPNDGDYAVTLAGTVDLTPASSPVLAFWQKLAFNNLYYSGNDTAYVEASTDGGITWSQLTTFGSGNNTTTWSQQLLSLTSYVGKRVKIRFRVWDNASGPAGTADGWYLDDVELREAF